MEGQNRAPEIGAREERRGPYDRRVIADFVAAVPKVELHLHLVGSASPETVLQLARRHPDGGVPTDADALARFYEFTDFPHFINVYAKVDGLVRDAADVRTLLLGLARDAAQSNVRYAEVTVTAAMHLAKGMSAAELTDALTVGRDDALREHGVALNWIFDIPAGFGAQAVEDTLAYAVEERPPGTVALGLAGLEVGYPRANYRPAFDRGADAGLHLVAHAGETTGPEEVWAAVADLRAERIGHGIGSVGDDRLLAHLRAEDIPLEVCLISNLRTRAAASLHTHPLPRLLAAGVPVTLSTDDPGMFDTDLNREYAAAAALCDLDEPAVAEIARAGVRAAFCDEDQRSRLLGEIDEVLAGGA